MLGCKGGKGFGRACSCPNGWRGASATGYTKDSERSGDTVKGDGTKVPSSESDDNKATGLVGTEDND